MNLTQEEIEDILWYLNSPMITMDEEINVYPEPCEIIKVDFKRKKVTERFMMI